MIASGQLLLVVVTSVLLGAASATIAVRIRYQAEGIGTFLPKTVAGIVLLNTLLFAWRIESQGVYATVGSTFDCTILLATLLTAVAWFSGRNRAVLGLDSFLLPIATIIQVGAFTMLFRPTATAPSAAWFVVHQIFIVIGGTFFVCGGVSGAVYLALLRALRSKRPSMMLGRFAALESWERLGRWCTMLGFAFFTLGVLTGICRMFHIEASKRPSWLSDAFIVLCIVLWGTYAAGVLATWLVPSFRGRKAALLATGTGAALVIVFLIVDSLSVVHQ